MSEIRSCERAIRSSRFHRWRVVLMSLLWLSLTGSSAWAVDSLIHVEAGKVGIGVDPTILPVPVLLNIKGSAPGDALIKVQNTYPSSYSGLEFHNAAGTPGFFFGVNNNNDTTRLNSFNNFPFLMMTNSQERIRITPEGNIGLSQPSPLHPLHVGTDSSNGNGAYLTADGAWVNGSSRQNKEEIRHLDYEDAVTALADLEPVRYRGRDSIDGEEYLGFIAEEVPELLAMNGRRGVSPMDVVAVLTKVSQEQQRMLSALATRVAELEAAREASEAVLQRCQAASAP